MKKFYYLWLLFRKLGEDLTTKKMSIVVLKQGFYCLLIIRCQLGSDCSSAVMHTTHDKEAIDSKTSGFLAYLHFFPKFVLHQVPRARKGLFEQKKLCL